MTRETSSGTKGFRIIRAGAWYRPAILVALPDAEPEDSSAHYYELNHLKDGRGILGWKNGRFNKITEREAMFALGPMTVSWGFAEPPEEVFPSLEAAIAFIKGTEVVAV